MRALSLGLLTLVLLCGCTEPGVSEVAGAATDTTVTEPASTAAPSTTTFLPQEQPPVVPPPCAPAPVPEPVVAANPDEASVTEVDPSDPCVAPENGVLETPTADVVASALAGRWRLCGTTSVFGTAEGGIEIGADGYWWKLDADYGRLPGWGNGGAWELIDTSAMNGPGHFSLNLAIDGQGTVVSSPVFTSDAAKMRLNNSGFFIADYVLLSR